MDSRETDVVIVEGVSKIYRLRPDKQALLETLYQWVTGTLTKPRDIHALRDLSFRVRRGESLGIVGSNGAGKSTLLKILGRITLPSAGRVEVRARVATQLALGSGFHPFLTGRENALLQGSILGMSNRRMRTILPEIIEFAGLEDVIDRQLWTYSSGMIARLGFSVASHTEFELLLLDEALAAGDLAFRERCEQTLSRFRASGATMVIVSHGTENLRRLCDRGIWLDRGSIRCIGPMPEVIAQYERSVGGARPERSARAR